MLFACVPWRQSGAGWGDDVKVKRYVNHPQANLIKLPPPRRQLLLDFPLLLPVELRSLIPAYHTDSTKTIIINLAFNLHVLFMKSKLSSINTCIWLYVITSTLSHAKNESQ